MNNVVASFSRVPYKPCIVLLAFDDPVSSYVDCTGMNDDPSAYGLHIRREALYVACRRPPLMRHKRDGGRHR